MEQNNIMYDFYSNVSADKLHVLEKISEVKDVLASDEFNKQDSEIQYLIKRQLSQLENYLWNSSDITNRLVEIQNEEYFSPERK